MLVFFYTLTTGMAATLRIFSLTNLYVAMARQPHELPGESAANPLFVTLVEPQPDSHRTNPSNGVIVAHAPEAGGPPKEEHNK